jgi:imidazolonepropionase-like amidohydrolase
MNMLILNFFGDTVDTRSPLRFTLPAQKTATLDLNSVEMKEFISLLKTKNVAVDPTVGIFESMFTARDKKIDPAMLPIVDRLPLSWQRSVKAGGGGLPVPEGMDETYRKSFDVVLKLTKLLYDNGIPILPGTDGLSGFALHRELELYVQAGIPANKVLQLATLGAAQYTGKDKEYGSITVGKKADFLLIDGDPVHDISSIRKSKLVITAGKIYDPAKLYSAVSIKPF